MRTPDFFDKQIYYRLIALWVLCEGVLGGIMHGLNIPFSGLIIASCAVICIALIGYYVPVKGAILRATIIVAIFKLMLSPHTSPSAYVAVFFQGMVGQLLFYNLRFFSLSCVLLGSLSLVESAAQRVIVLTVLYGTNFWNAANEFIRKITGHTTITNYTLLVAMGYIILHAIVGLMVGSFAASIVWQSKSWTLLHEDYLIDSENEKKILQATSKRHSKKKIKTVFLVIWAMIVLLFLQSYFKIGSPLLPASSSIQILLRSVLIILTWYFILSPVLLYFIKKWLSSQRERSQSDINEVIMILPSTRYIFLKSWKLSASEKGFKRLFVCCKIVLVNTLRKKR